MNKTLKKLSLLALAYIGLHSAALAVEPDFCSSLRTYVGVSGNYTWHSKTKFDRLGLIIDRDHKPGFGGSLHLGLQEDCWKIELEGLFLHNKLKSVNIYDRTINRAVGNTLKKGHTRDIAILLNVIYSIPVHEMVSLELGVGAGIDFNKTHIELNDNRPPLNISKTLLAAKAQGDLVFHLTDTIDASIGYMVFGTQKVKDHKGYKCKNFPIHHGLTAGLRFKF